MESQYLDPRNLISGKCFLCLNSCNIGANCHLSCAEAYIDFRKAPEIIELWREASRNKKEEIDNVQINNEAISEEYY